MAPQVEEILVDADLLALQNLGPQSRQGLFGGGRRRPVDSGLDRRGARRRQGPTVDFAGGVERQLGEPDETRRHHIVGQSRRQVTPQADYHIVTPIVVSGEVGDQTLFARRFPGCSLPLHHDHRTTDRRVASEHRLDLSQLNAKPADLDLVIDAAQEIDPAVRPMTRQITGKVQAPAALPERVGDELSRSAPRSAEVTSRQARAADQELTRDAGRRRPQAGVGHEGPRLRQRAADRRAFPRVVDPAGGGTDGGLRRAVMIDDPAARSQLADPGEQSRVSGLTTENQPPGRQDALGMGPGEQGLEVGRHDLEDVHRLGMKPRFQGRGIGHLELRDHLQTAARA